MPKRRLSTISLWGGNAAQKEAPQSNELFRRVVDSLGDAVCLCDIDDIILHANPKLCALLHLRLDEIIGRRAYEIMLPEGSWDLMRARTKRRLEGLSDEYELKIQRADGSEFWAKIHATPFRDDDGQIIGSLGSIRDISTERALQEQLGASELQYRSLVETCTDLLWTTDTRGVITFMNSASERIYGLPPDEMVGREFSEFELESSNGASFAEAFKLIPGEASLGRITQHRGKNDLVVDLKINIIALKGPDGGTQGYAGIAADVTQQTRTLTSLRESEERLRQYFNLPLIGVGAFGPDDKWIDCNPMLANLLRGSKERILPLPWHSFTHPADIAATDKLRAMLSAGEADQYSIDKRLVCLDGSTLFVSESVCCVRNPDGSPKYFTILLQDITDRIKAETDLKRQQQYLRDILDANPNFIFARDINGTFTLANKTFASLFGIRPEDMIGKKTQDFPRLNDELDKVLLQDRMVIESGRPLFVPERIFFDPETGGARWVQTIKKPLRSPDGSSIHALAVLTDITARKDAENALRAIVEGTAAATAENFFRSLVFHLAKVLGAKYSLIATIAPDHQDLAKTIAVWWLDGYRDNFEYPLLDGPSAGVVGSSIQSFNEGVSAAFPRDEISKETNASSYIGAPIFDSNGRSLGILAVWDDRPRRDWNIARPILSILAARAGAELERLHAEEEAQKLQRQFTQSQKMEAIGQLAAGVAHDLNNALSAVVGHLQLIGLSTPTAQIAKSVDVALTGCERASSLISQLLGFSRQGKYNLTTIKLQWALEQTVNFLERILGKDIRIVMPDLNRPIYVSADPAQTQQALINLIINAKQAMPGGGEIKFSCDAVQVTNPERFNVKAKPGRYAVLRIADSGTGIPAEKLHKIFEPFFTTKSEAGGSGLGLAMVYGVMQGHGGWVDVESVEGEGAAFSLFFPEAAPPGETKEEAAEETKPAPFGRIAIVDDEEPLVDLAVQFIESSGLTADGFASGEIFLDWYKQNWQSVDLIILDMKMPGFDGPKMFGEIRTINPSARVAILSGYIHDDSAQNLLKSGALKFFQKPLKYPELTKWIVETLRGRDEYES